MDYRNHLDLYLPPRRASSSAHDSKFMSYQHLYYPQKGRTPYLGPVDFVDGTYIFCQGPHVHYCCPCICSKRRSLYQEGPSCKIEPTVRSRRRRNRTVYTDEQTAELEEVFQGKKYLDSEEKQQLAEKLEVKTENIEIWFKNRRSKWRKHGKGKSQHITSSVNGANLSATGNPVSTEGMWKCISTHAHANSKGKKDGNGAG